MTELWITSEFPRITCEGMTDFLEASPPVILSSDDGWPPCETNLYDILTWNETPMAWKGSKHSWQIWWTFHSGKLLMETTIEYNTNILSIQSKKTHKTTCHWKAVSKAKAKPLTARSSKEWTFLYSPNFLKTNPFAHYMGENKKITKVLETN